MGKALCVIPGPSFDCGPWIRRTGAVCLAQGFEVDPGTELSADVRRLLDHMILFDGHNGFIGGGGKEDAIRTLRRISGLSDPPTSKAIEEYIAGSGGTRGDGARRAANWYDDIRAGKRHYDYARRPI
jgi:hypothetical protein